MTQPNWKKRATGLLVPPFALRSPDTLGIGDIDSLEDAIRFCAKLNIRVCQILPFNELGDDHSPYSAISSLALDWRTLAMTPSKVPGLTAEDLANLAPKAIVGTLEQGPINYHSVSALKETLLTRAFRQFASGAEPHPELESFEKFQRQTEWLPRYTLFKYLMERYLTANWAQWPADVHNYQDGERKAAEYPDCAHRRRFWAYVQWVAHRQWSGLRRFAEECGVDIMADIPFGVALSSLDTWAYPQLFVKGWSGGAPPEPAFQPDEFTKRLGQNWGIGVYDWEVLRAENYRWWKARIAQILRYSHRFRFDHILGVFRLYAFPWTPDHNQEFTDLSPDQIKERTGGLLPRFVPRGDETSESAAKNGDEGREILRVFIEAANSCNGTFAGEDLGTVPSYVRPVLANLGIPGYHIPQWERASDSGEYVSVESIKSLRIATWATHDHDPIVMRYCEMVRKWTGADGHKGWLEMQRLMRFLGLPDNQPPISPAVAFNTDLLLAFWDSLLRSPSVLAVFIVSDLLAEPLKFNTPGIGSGSWTLRLDKPLTEYLDDPKIGPRLAAFAKLIELRDRL